MDDSGVDRELSPRGKTSRDTDTFTGKFVKLVPGERIVQAVEFESDEAAYAGEMTITWTLADSRGGTEVTALCENLPPGVRPEDNEAGSRSTLKKLAAFLE